MRMPYTETMGAKFLFLLVFALLLAAGGYYLYGRSQILNVTNYPSNGTDIIAYGDSLVYGEGASDGHDFVSLLSRDIGQNIFNLGIPGETTAEGLRRLSGLDTYNPKVVILLLGGNDAIQHVSPDETFDNLAAIIENIQRRGAIVLLLGIQGGVLSDPYAGRFNDLSRQEGAAYVSNVLDGLIGHPEYMSDEVHPNDAGYAKIEARVLPVLQRLIK